MARIVAVVVTYNRKKLLQECLGVLDKQTYPLSGIVVVNNCSTDGTTKWLQTIQDKKYKILTMPENIGGAGGFCIGMQEACKQICDYVLVLDDDCILDADYVEKLLYTAHKHKHSLSALCGTVYENDRIAVNHRGYIIENKLGHILDSWHEHDDKSYLKDSLNCDIVSFCGLMVSRTVIDKVGYPKAEYFIKRDDTEYSLRLGKYGKIMNVNSACLNHKVSVQNSKQSFDWKYYYDIRNGIDMTRNNGLYYCQMKIIMKSLWVSIANHGVDLWVKAVRDGLKGRLGKREN